MVDFPAISGFTIIGELGEGGVAKVFRARPVDNDGLPPEVALKVLKPEIVEHRNIVASFEYEMRVLSRLDHPAVMRMYDNGATHRTVWAAVQLVEGTPFDEELTRRGKLSEREALGYGIQILEALDHVHGRGYVHRDLKPGNLMLDGEQLVLMDFGTAVKSSSTIDYEGGLYGTVPYLSPEQVMQKPRIDGRSDLYAVGVMLYRMVVGKRPFQGLRDDVLRAHVELDPPQPNSHKARISAEFEALILQCLAKRPDERPASAAHLRDELRVIEAAAPAQKVGLRGLLRR